MPKPKQKKETVEEQPKVVQEPHPRTVFVEKYKSKGYNAADIDGVLMFTGKYKIEDIKEMLDKDGYRGSYGVRTLK